VLRARPTLIRNLDNSKSLGYNTGVVSGAVAQSGERYNRTVEVEGSNPFGSTENGTQIKHG
jgi:hypothetical protein